MGRSPQASVIRQIIDGVFEGRHTRYLVDPFHAQLRNIKAAQELRPELLYSMRLMYIYEDGESGKTYAVQSVRSTIKKTHPTFTYYQKLGGICKWWEGYDNQHIVWMGVGHYYHHRNK